MDRETRKANLKKLQLTGMRTTRSKKTTPSTSISKYFATPQKVNNDVLENNERLPTAHTLTTDSQEKLPQLNAAVKRTKLSNFLFKDENDIPDNLKPKKQRESDAFEKTQKKVKKAPKLSTKSATSKPRAKRQTNIKSAFLRNEEIFSKITAQHCIADNFSPDDIELALAISKSESETNGVYPIDNKTEDVVELVDIPTEQLEQITGNNIEESVRSKLQKYGFRTAAKEDYNNFAEAFLPNAGKRRKKAKWANKFTALTLRNPEIQLKKINANITAIIEQQTAKKPLSAEECAIVPYKLMSDTLAQIHVNNNDRVFISNEHLATVDFTYFFVKDLFDVSEVKAGYLLKDFRKIPGRDLSPEPPTTKSRIHARKLKVIYLELEEIFGACKKVKPTTKADNECENIAGSKTKKSVFIPVETLTKTTKAVENECELDELLNLLKETSNTCDQQANTKIAISQDNEISSTVSTPNKEPPDKRTKLETLDLHENIRKSDHNTINSLKVSTQTMRSISPDIFADSDEENEVSDPINEFTASACTNTTTNEVRHDIALFEIFSSDDDVKLVRSNDEHDEGSVTQSADQADDIIDLTQLVDTPLSDSDSGAEEEGKTDRAAHLLNMTTEPDLLQLSPVDLFNEENKEKQSNCVQNNEDFTLYNSFLSQKSNNEDDLQDILDAPSFLNLDDNRSQTKSNEKPASNEKEWQNLLRKYGIVEQCKRKSVSMTQIPTANNNEILRQQDISFTQMHPERSFKAPRKSAEFFTKQLSNSSSCTLKSNKSVNDLSTSSVLSKSRSIDLTQNDDDDDFDDNCLLLSDDEINYSIWKADKTINTKEKHEDNFTLNNLNDTIPATERLTLASVDDDDELLLVATSQKSSEVSSTLSRSPNKSDLSRERAEFGILDAAISQTLSQLDLYPSTSATVNSQIDWTETTFLDMQVEHKTATSMKHFRSRNSEKFDQLLAEFDEFDEIVYGNNDSNSVAEATHALYMPTDLDKLLKAEISFAVFDDQKSQTPTKQQNEKIKSNENMPTASEQFELNGNVYNVRFCQTTKPDFTQQTDAELLKQLYNYGIKALKRKQAIKMLEFIYNQTHPIMVEDDGNDELLEQAPDPVMLKNTQSTTAIEDKRIVNATQSQNSIPSEPSSNKQANHKFVFEDATGSVLVRFAHELSAELLEEHYILQTNVTKKTPQPLLPFHIAWFNLVCANPILHETVLMYEPIDLQEIYLYLKSLGYRYDPKDLKGFFDKRCIIFRYDLTAPGRQAERHVRRMTKKKSHKKIC